VLDFPALPFDAQLKRALSSGVDPLAPEPVEPASEVWSPPDVVPALDVPAVLPAEPELPVPLPAAPDGLGLVGVQNNVFVVWPAGSVGCGFADCGKQVGETPGVSAKAGAAVCITAKTKIGAAPRAADSAISLRTRTPPKRG
jgi:hypothetical protein